MTRVQIVADHGASHSAWTKAPADVAKIAEGLGFARVAAGRFRLGNFSFVRRVLRKLRLERLTDRVCWKLELASLRRRFGRDGGALLLQHPLPGSWTFDVKNIDDLASLKRQGVNITVLVHDIGALRGSSKDVGGGEDHSIEKKLFLIADKLIVHNDCMKDYLVKEGIDCQIAVLSLFDYLMPAGIVESRNIDDDNRDKVLLAGAFGSGKARYVQDLKNIKGVDWTLYGINYDPKSMDGANVHYKGSFDPECPPLDNDCRFGLVWDGDSVETCSGPTGQYLKVNNPHKLSLYLSMGLPVIVWNEAAVANYVRKEGVGILINSIQNIPLALKNMTDDEYRQLSENACRVGASLRLGTHTKSALE